MTAAMKLIARGIRSPPGSPISLKTPVSVKISIQTPSPPKSRKGFPQTVYFYKPAHHKTRDYCDAWAQLNPTYEIRVFDTAQCEQFLLEEYGELYRDIFRFMSDETIQSAFLGICILYAYGGIYSDIGNEPLLSLNNIIESDVDFVTCNSYLYAINSYWADMKFNFNPIFIASQKDNSILKNCIDWYLCRYETKHPYDYWGWSMMKAFTEILRLDNHSTSDGIYMANGVKLQILKESVENENYTVYCEYGGKRVMNIST
jgi:hypothetical protein